MKLLNLLICATVWYWRCSNIVIVDKGVSVLGLAHSSAGSEE